MKIHPTMMGSYEIMEVIGKGAMGTVYRLRNPKTCQLAAIKVMDTEAAAHPVLVKRFEQEFIAAGRLCHPHIVRALDFGLHDGRRYLVMEFVERAKSHGTHRATRPNPAGRGRPHYSSGGRRSSLRA